MNKVVIGFVAVMSLASFACGKKGGGADAVKKFSEFKDAMCKCGDGDTACAQKVIDDQKKYADEMAKSADKDAKPDPELAKKMEPIMAEYTKCATKAMTPKMDKPPADPATPKVGDTGAKPAGDLNADSVSVEWTGKFEKGDAPGQEWPMAKVTNNSKTKLHYIKAYQYYYDKDKKQVGREFGERTVGSLEPGQSKEFPFGLDKDKLPKGTEKIEFVFTGGNFADKVEFNGDVKTLAPDNRPMKGS